MNLLNLVLPWWVKPVAIALALLAYGAFVGIKVHQHDQLVFNDYKAQKALEATRIYAKRVEVLHDIEVRYVDRAAKIIKQVETIEKEVRVYVTQADDDRCQLNAGFLRVHDAAFSGTDPPAPSESDGADSGLALSQVSETIAYNAGLCRRWKERAMSLQEAYEQVRGVGDVK